MFKRVLFSVTPDDFDPKEPGKKASGVTLIHRPSGATGTCGTFKSRYMNTRTAFYSALDTQEFNRWLSIEIRRRKAADLVEFVITKTLHPKLEVRVRSH